MIALKKKKKSLRFSKTLRFKTSSGVRKLVNNFTNNFNMNLTKKDKKFANFSFPKADHESPAGSGRPGDEYLG